MDGFENTQLHVKKIGVYIPVVDEFFNPPPPPPMPWHKRMRWAFADWRFRTRERVGFWIAGYTPD